jgi:hypothetical protein
VLSKSTHSDRFEEDGASFDLSLSPTDMTHLESLDRSGRTGARAELVVEISLVPRHPGSSDSLSGRDRNRKLWA